MKKSKNLVILALLIFVLFRGLLAGTGVYGDAPYFFSSEAGGLLTEPLAWVYRGTVLGGVQQIMWLYPIMFLWGALIEHAGLSSEIIVRILFYIPSIVLSFSGAYCLAREVGLKKLGKFVVTLFYLVNTYYLLLIDGGVLGVLLAYGVFPFAVVFLLKMIHTPNVKSFYMALIVAFILGSIDPRVFALSFLLASFLALVKIPHNKRTYRKSIVGVSLLAVSLAGLWGYWIVPLFKFGAQAQGLGGSGDEYVSLLHSLSLFQPHWPGNQFGLVSPPPFYFVLLPIVLVVGAIFVRDKEYKRLMFIYLLLVFLAKGASYPLGGIYEFIVKNVPFFVAFRDSTKFYIPLIPVVGILLGKIVDNRKSKVWQYVVFMGTLVFVWQAYAGLLTGTFTKQSIDSDYKAVAEKLSSEQNFYRTVWFTETSPYSYETQTHPAVSAKELVTLRPFATLNTGTYDKFNFLHNPEYISWMKLLGMKYLVFSGDPRDKYIDEDEQTEWRELNDLVASDSGLLAADINTSINIYDTGDVYPHIFALQKLYVVVGGDSVYGVNGFDNRGLAFLEDGKFELSTFDEIATESATLVYNKEGKSDLEMGYLQEYFATVNTNNSQWAVRRSEDYLQYKYELLTKGINFEGFDYGKGISYSTEPNEDAEIMLRAPYSGDYTLAIRVLGTGEEKLKYKLSNEVVLDEGEVENSDSFLWFTKKIHVGEGEYRLTLTNLGGVRVLNVAALIPQMEYEKAKVSAQDVEDRFGYISSEEFEKIGGGQPQAVEITDTQSGRYELSLPEGYPWIVISDAYNDKWEFRHGPITYSSVPFYSIVNGFYRRPEWNEGEIFFTGQETVRWGVWLSVISMIGLVALYLILLSRLNEENI